MAADGSKVYATYNGGIYISTNSGFNWNLATSAPSLYWTPVICSPDGSAVFAGVFDGGLYASTDSGTTWSLLTNAPTAGWQSLALSTYGDILLAGAIGGELCLSTNGGATWPLQYDSPHNAPLDNWDCVFCSADGTRLVAGGYGDNIYTAVNPLLAPKLKLKSIPQHAVLSWPLFPAGFQLQTTSTIFPAPTWTNVLGSAVKSGTNYIFTNSLAGSGAFFRLAKP